MDAKQRNLLADDGKVVPASATIHAALFDSSYLKNAEMLDGESMHEFWSDQPRH
jgi:hypothetical protein